MTPATVEAARDAFNTRELFKLKVLEAAPDTPRDTAHTLAARLEDVQVVQVIGRTVVLYRPHPDRPEVVLPRQR